MTRPDGTDETHASLVMSGIGIDAAMIANTNPDLKKRVGWLAYVDAGLRAIPASKPFRVVHRIDAGRLHRSRVSSILVANLGYLPGNIELIPDAEIDDGKLDVVVLQPRNLMGWLLVWRKVAWENRVLRKSAIGRQFIDLTGGKRRREVVYLARPGGRHRDRGRRRGVRDRRRRVRHDRVRTVPRRPGRAHRARPALKHPRQAPHQHEAERGCRGRDAERRQRERVAEVEERPRLHDPGRRRLARPLELALRRLHRGDGPAEAEEEQDAEHPQGDRGGVRPVHGRSSGVRPARPRTAQVTSTTTMPMSPACTSAGARVLTMSRKVSSMPARTPPM